jgi:hypothetical protein
VNECQPLYGGAEEEEGWDGGEEEAEEEEGGGGEVQLGLTAHFLFNFTVEAIRREHRGGAEVGKSSSLLLHVDVERRVLEAYALRRGNAPGGGSGRGRACHILFATSSTSSTRSLLEFEWHLWKWRAIYVRP